MTKTEWEEIDHRIRGVLGTALSSLHRRRATDGPHEDHRHARTYPPVSDKNFRVPWVLLVAFLLGLMGTGYAMLDARKADKDAVTQIQNDVRDIKNYLMPPLRGSK